MRKPPWELPFSKIGEFGFLRGAATFRETREQKPKKAFAALGVKIIFYCFMKRWCSSLLSLDRKRM